MFGLHGRRFNRAVNAHLEPGETVEAYARAEIQRDYWVLTTRALVVLDESGSTVKTRVPLTDLTGSVSHTATGFTVHVASSRASGATMIGAFRTANDVTRRLAALLNGSSPA